MCCWRSTSGEAIHGDEVDAAINSPDEDGVGWEATSDNHLDGPSARSCFNETKVVSTHDIPPSALPDVRRRDRGYYRLLSEEVLGQVCSHWKGCAETNLAVSRAEFPPKLSLLQQSRRSGNADESDSFVPKGKPPQSQRFVPRRGNCDCGDGVDQKHHLERQFADTEEGGGERDRPDEVGRDPSVDATVVHPIAMVERLRFPGAYAGDRSPLPSPARPAPRRVGRG